MDDDGREQLNTVLSTGLDNIGRSSEYSVYIFTQPDRAIEILNWLCSNDADLFVEVTAITYYRKVAESLNRAQIPMPFVAFEDIQNSIAGDDLFIVATNCNGAVVADLKKRSIVNIIEIPEIPEPASAKKFTDEVVPGSGITKYSLWQGEQSSVDTEDFESYIAAPINRSDILIDQNIVINSVPKSGTVWMMAMLAQLLDIDSISQIHLAHVNDIHDVENRAPYCLGTVVVVRDLRDVVVSWFHEVSRLDHKVGFSSPRYPELEEFYFEHLLGLLQSNPRYNGGDLEGWLDLVTGRAYPLIRYEDMVVSASPSLEKILKFWKISVPENAIADAVKSCAFSNLTSENDAPSGRAGESIEDRHLRGGRVGDWIDVLPESVVDDIERRFVGYQTRLGYQ